MRYPPLFRRTATVATISLAGLCLAASLPSAPVVADASKPAAMHVHRAHGHTAHNHCRRSKLDVPQCGVLWGVFRAPVAATPYWKPRLGQYERQVSRRFDIVKDYTDFRPGDTFPNPAFTRLGNHHRVVYISWNATNYQTHAKVSYASIARGAWDKSVLLPEARRLKQYHHRIIIDFDHEFDSRAQSGKGTPEQYVAAYRHIHRFMARAGVHNVIWSWVSTGYLGHKDYIKRGYPGRRYVDWVGYDPYNFAQCLHVPWRSARRTLYPFYRWSRHQSGMRSKPLIIAEYGSAPGPRLRHWYGSVASVLQDMPRVKAAIQFSAYSAVPCRISLSFSDDAMKGFARSGRTGYVLGH
jgi:hypothetical protein